MSFASDNVAGAHPRIIEAIARVNEGGAPAYGADDASRRAGERFCEIFEREVAVFFVATGGAANALALSQITPPWGMILCHQESHIQMDECGAPEFFTGGAKLLPLEGPDAKLLPDAVRRALGWFPERPPHGMPIKALSLTQANECGVVYTPGEVAELCQVARGHGLKVHMDGARLANAVAALGCAPADITWRAGVDVLAFGGTKNGCIAAEAVIFFNPADTKDFMYRRKRSGHLFSKSRFIAAQFNALFEDGLWLDLARRANASAARLSAGLVAAGAHLWRPTDANAVFVSFPPGMEERLIAAGAAFYPWKAPGDPAAGAMRRLVCSWATTDAEIDRALAAARGA